MPGFSVTLTIVYLSFDFKSDGPHISFTYFMLQILHRHPLVSKMLSPILAQALKIVIQTVYNV